MLTRAAAFHRLVRVAASASSDENSLKSLGFLRVMTLCRAGVHAA
jgi:hypothetical protein